MKRTSSTAIAFMAALPDHQVCDGVVRRRDTVGGVRCAGSSSTSGGAVVISGSDLQGPGAEAPAIGRTA